VKLSRIIQGGLYGVHRSLSVKSSIAALRRAKDLAVESANFEPSIALTRTADRPLAEQTFATLLHLL
jgi:hypothetical protein